MISEWTVLSWLNRYNPSQLKYDIENDIRKIRSEHISAAEQTMLLNSLMNMAPSPNMQERAEVYVNCAVLCYARALVLDAVGFLRKAEGIYHHAMDYHRLAIADWLLFNIHHGLGDYDAAIYWCQQARTNLWTLAKLWMQQKDSRRERWYRERVFDLTQDLISFPYYVHNNLFEFHGSRLSASAQTLKGKVQELMLDSKHDQACQLLDQFQQITRFASDPNETGEAAAFIALQQYLMGNPFDAIRLLQFALAQFSPGGHEAALVRWMLGIIQYQLPDYRTRAVKNLEDSYADVGCLAEKADHQNLPIPHQWYLITAEAMRRALKKMSASLGD